MLVRRVFFIYKKTLVFSVLSVCDSIIMPRAGIEPAQLLAEGF
jgi:hypothetical protein